VLITQDGQPALSVQSPCPSYLKYVIRISIYDSKWSLDSIPVGEGAFPLPLVVEMSYVSESVVTGFLFYHHKIVHLFFFL
jgi:hypothetical protein